MTSSSVSIVAPAKVNLTLKVTGRRDDGMHELDTVVLPLDLADRVHATLCIERKCINEWSLSGVAEDEELGLRAARLLAERANVRSGVALRIDKQIPLGSGLGGGSSDAAATLLACNRLWQLRWPMAKLAELGSELGADVPFFIYCRQARLRGAGENISFTRDQRIGWCVLCVPDFTCATSQVYEQYDRLAAEKPPANDEVLNFARTANDLTAAAVALHPEISGVLHAVAAVAGEARLSGSGSACYALFAQRKEAWEAAEQLAEQPLRVWVAQIMNSRSNKLGVAKW